MFMISIIIQLVVRTPKTEIYVIIFTAISDNIYFSLFRSEPNGYHFICILVLLTFVTSQVTFNMYTNWTGSCDWCLFKSETRKQSRYVRRINSGQAI